MTLAADAPENPNKKQTRESGHIDKFWACIPIITTNQKLAPNRDVTYGKLLLFLMSFEGWSRLDIVRKLVFGMLIIGHPSNEKTPGETVNLKAGYFLTCFMLHV